MENKEDKMVRLISELTTFNKTIFNRLTNLTEKERVLFVNKDDSYVEMFKILDNTEKTRKDKIIQCCELLEKERNKTGNDCFYSFERQTKDLSDRLSYSKQDLFNLLKKEGYRMAEDFEDSEKRISDFNQEFGDLYRISTRTKNGKTSIELLTEEELESLGGARFYQYNGKLKSESSKDMLNYFYEKMNESDLKFHSLTRENVEQFKVCFPNIDKAIEDLSVKVGKNDSEDKKFYKLIDKISENSESKSVENIAEKIEFIIGDKTLSRHVEILKDLLRNKNNQDIKGLIADFTYNPETIAFCVDKKDNAFIMSYNYNKSKVNEKKMDEGVRLRQLDRFTYNAIKREEVRKISELDSIQDFLGAKSTIEGFEMAVKIVEKTYMPKASDFDFSSIVNVDFEELSSDLFELNYLDAVPNFKTGDKIFAFGKSVIDENGKVILKIKEDHEIDDLRLKMNKEVEKNEVKQESKQRKRMKP